MSDITSVLSGASRWHVEHGDAVATLRALPDGCANLIWCDPPYFRVVNEAWDRAWRTESAFLDWLQGVVAELCRVLAPNGSLYVFASPQMAARVEVIATKYSRVLNHIVWAKPSGMHLKQSPEASRLWRTQTERVIFAEKRGPLGGSPIGDAIRTARERRGFTQDELDCAIGRRRRGDATKGSGLVRLQERGERLPNAEDFAAVLRACGDERDDAVLRAEYLRLLRPFECDRLLTEVWDYEPAPPGGSTRHPCEKPAAMCRDIVLASSRLGDLVLDPFAGSFVMAEAALNNGRRYVGCDADPHWAATGRTRAEAVCNGTAVAVVPRKPDAVPARQRGLFDAEVA